MDWGFGRNHSAERTNVSESLLTCGKAFTAETAYRISRKSFSQSTILLTYRGPLRFGLPAPSWRTSEPKALDPPITSMLALGIDLCGPWRSMWKELQPTLSSSLAAPTQTLKRNQFILHTFLVSVCIQFRYTWQEPRSPTSRSIHDSKGRRTVGYCLLSQYVRAAQRADQRIRSR